MDDIRIRGSEIAALIKAELGFDQNLDLGPTGRTLHIRWSTGPEDSEEYFEFNLEEVLEEANVLTEDDLQDALKDGLETMLRNDKALLTRQINEAIDRLKAKQLEDTEYVKEVGVAAQ